MATAQFEELKLSVVLVDEASTGLTQLRAELRNFEADSIRFLKSARDSAQALKLVGREADEVVKGLRAKGAILSRAAGVISTVTGAYYGTIVYLAKFALEVEQVANAAQLLGVTYADLRNISEQMARKGLSPETGGRILGAVNNLALQLQNLGGIQEFQNRLQTGGKIQLNPEQLEAYTQALINARGWHERLRIIQNAANTLERKGLEAGRRKDEVAADREQFYVLQGLPRELALTGDIAATTGEQGKRWGKLEEDAKKWNEVTHKIIKNVSTIVAIFNADSMDPDGPFYFMLKTAVRVTGYIDKHLATWIRHLTDAGAFLADVFGGKPEEEGPPKPREIPPVEDQDVFNPGFSPTSLDDDLPVRLEKLILEFRRFNENLRTGAPTGPEVVPASFASLGSMATPGLQLPPAAMAGDIYTDKYGIWPGGGAKPAGSDVGPGSGAGPASGFGGFGGHPVNRPVEGSFRGGVSRLWTPGGIYIGRRFDPTGGGAADGDGDEGPRGGRMPEPIPGDFRMPGGTGPLGSYKNVVAQPDYLAGTEPSTNIQDVRSGSWGGAGGAGGTSQPPILIPPGLLGKEKSVFVPGLDVPAPKYPTSNAGMRALLESEEFELKPESQRFEPGSMRDLISKNPALYRRGAEKTSELIKLRQEREAAELSEPSQFRWPAPRGPQRGPGELIPPGISGDQLDRRAIDAPMGREMGGGIEGGAGFRVDVNAPRGTVVNAEATGNIFNGNTEINRGPPPMEESIGD
jgi:hypothetical protein